MRTRILVMSDWHCGSELGLYKPGTEFDNGATYNPNKFQEFLYREFEGHCEYAAKTKWQTKRIFVFNGDIVQGTGHRDVALISSNMHIQERIASACLGVVDKIYKPSSYFFIRGTEIHDGLASQSMERVASDFGKPVNGSVSKNRLRININNVLLDFKHHVGSTLRGYTIVGNIVREVADVILESANLGVKPPDMVIRSHTHMVADSAGNYPNTRGIVTGCYQLDTAYGARITSRSPSIGGLVIDIHNGVIENVTIFDKRIQTTLEVKI